MPVKGQQLQRKPAAMRGDLDAETRDHERSRRGELMRGRTHPFCGETVRVMRRPQFSFPHKRGIRTRTRGGRPLTVSWAQLRLLALCGVSGGRARLDFLLL